MGYAEWWKAVTDNDWNWQIAAAIKPYADNLTEAIFKPKMMCTSIQLRPNPTKDDVICDLFEKCFYGIWYYKRHYHKEYIRLDISIESLVYKMMQKSVAADIEFMGKDLFKK